jgi:hypothetical protein
MEATKTDQFTCHPDEISSVVRRLAHDVRNGLNGLEMELSLLEELNEDSGDQLSRESIQRMRRQGGEIESAIRFAICRFAQPSSDIIPASDLFSLWKSRSRDLPNSNSIDWRSNIRDASVRLDARMVVDAMCEGLLYEKGSPLEASVRIDGEEVLFEICRSPNSPGKPNSGGNEWPLWDYAILRNGGRVEVATGERRAFLRRFWFPVLDPATI